MKQFPTDQRFNKQLARYMSVVYLQVITVNI